MFWPTGTPLRTLDEDVLRCPSCGHEWLHQRKIAIFARTEDEERYQPLGMDCQRHSTPPIWWRVGTAQNPSPRRDGILIFFECEWCHFAEDEITGEPKAVPPLFELAIFQHKGNTIVLWRYPPEHP